MADFTATGFISIIKYHENNVVVNLLENRNGYKKSNGELVRNMVLNWRVTFKAYFKKYLSGNFHSGMYVQIKGEILPFSFNNDGTDQQDGYTILGQTINVAAFPKDTRREQKLQKESLEHAIGSPNLEEYLKNDF